LHLGSSEQTDGAEFTRLLSSGRFFEIDLVVEPSAV